MDLSSRETTRQWTGEKLSLGRKYGVAHDENTEMTWSSRLFDYLKQLRWWDENTEMTNKKRCFDRHFHEKSTVEVPFFFVSENWDKGILLIVSCIWGICWESHLCGQQSACSWKSQPQRRKTVRLQDKKASAGMMVENDIKTGPLW